MELCDDARQLRLADKLYDRQIYGYYDAYPYSFQLVVGQGAGANRTALPQGYRKRKCVLHRRF